MDFSFFKKVSMGHRMRQNKALLTPASMLALFGMLSLVSVSALANVGLRNTPLPEPDFYQAFPSRVVVLGDIPKLRNSDISSGFGWRYTPHSGGKNHDGIDIPAQTGSPILAAGTGRVIYAGFARGYGNIVVIDHGNGLTTRYAHAQQILVRLGDDVAQASPIATVGTTGNARTPHLHFELRQYQNPMNPQALLELDDLANPGSPRRLTVALRSQHPRAAISKQSASKKTAVLYTHDMKTSLEAGPRRKITPKPMYLTKESSSSSTQFNR